MALVGAANSGKTTLFNLLTRSHYATVNYPGATVEYAVGRIPDGSQQEPTLLDTPGITSLIPKSKDEEVTIKALFEGAQKPDYLLAVVDATQLSRHLYLVHQLKAAGFSFAVLVTMTDLLAAGEKQLMANRLENLLGCPVLCVNGRVGNERQPLLDFIHRLEVSGEPTLTHQALVQTVDDAFIAHAYEQLDTIEKKCILPADESPATPSPAASPKKKPSHNTGKAWVSDRILLHPVFGLAIFFCSMMLIFSSIFWFAQPLMDGIDTGFAWMVDALKTHLPSSWLVDMLADGLVAGVGAVVVFLPQIAILFFAMGYLEDSGYLARGAALMDKPLSKIGLNGRSFLPLLSGYACAIPAMMAARTIPNRLERLFTIMIIPLMSCSARLPVYALLLAFLTPRDKPWIGGLGLTVLYFMGFILGAAVATLLSRFIKNPAESSGFVLELPTLRRPLLRVVLKTTTLRAAQYLRKAGPTIVVISMGLWILTHTPPVPEKVIAPSQGLEHASQETSQQEAPQTPEKYTPTSPMESREAPDEYVTVSQSYASQMGRWIEPAMQPLGLDWRAGVAMISGFAAREVFVSALALMYRIEGEDDEGVAERMLSTMKTATIAGTDQRVFTVSSCIGLLVFFMIALQCFPTVVVSQKETGRWAIALTQLAVYTGSAYLLSLLTVQGLRALGVS